MNSKSWTVITTLVKIHQPANKNYQSIIEASLDKGEASAIVLAIELDDCLLIIDDFKGRKFAQQLGLFLEKIRATNFRTTEKLEILILKKAGE